MYWTLSQLVNRRANLKTHHIRLKNQLNEQICVAYPSYKQFFQDIARPTALYFWEHYPSLGLLRGKTVEELADSLLECQNIAEKALDEGYSVIKVQSYRDSGINYVIYDNFDEILQPQMVTPIGE